MDLLQSIDKQQIVSTALLHLNLHNLYRLKARNGAANE